MQTKYPFTRFASYAITPGQVFALVLVIFFYGCTQNHDAIANNDAAANRDSIDKYKGRWLVVNYWALWCEPCRKEIPQLNQFSRNNKAGAAVVGVNFDGITGNELQQQAARAAIEFDLLKTDPVTLGLWPRPEVLPTTLLVNPDGKVISTLTGPQTLESLTAALDAALRN